VNRYLFATLLLVSIHYSLSGIMLPEPPSHWLAPLTNDVRPIFGAAMGRLPVDERFIALVPAAVSVSGLGLGLFSLFGWLVPAGWYLPSLLTGAGAGTVLYLLFINQWALIPLMLDVAILWTLVGSRGLIPSLEG